MRKTVSAQTSSGRSASSDASASSDRAPCSTVSELLAALGDQLQAPAPNTRRIVGLLDSLGSKLRSHFFQQDNDALEEAVFQAPWLTGFAEALRHEYLDLQRSLGTLREKVTRSADGSATLAEVHEAHDYFVEMLEKHDEGCRNLLYESQLCQGHLHD